MISNKKTLPVLKKKKLWLHVYHVGEMQQKLGEGGSILIISSNDDYRSEHNSNMFSINIMIKSDGWTQRELQSQELQQYLRVLL